MNDTNPPAKRSGKLKYWIIGGMIVFGIVATAGIIIVGFTPAGITAGSIAAGIHAGIGGSVTAGSAFAILQSLGTMPLAVAAIGAAGGAIGGLLAGLVHRYAGSWFSRIFGAIKDAFCTTVKVDETLWLKLREMLIDSQGKVKML